uniref:Putative viral protein found on panstrongylus lignarius transcriptome n=1 Tax=Panstrongylus lignarius TaxID=156445 RepID=A0A224X8A8_9HEMI
MDLLKLTELFITILLTTSNCHTISPIPTNNKWFARDLITDQGLHSLLGSIDDKLRIIDSVRFSINRVETTMARMSSKIDSIESQLSTVQTSMHIKMREVYEVLLKHDFQREQIIHKCEASQSRLLHKINLLESRLEDSFQKLQGNSEINLGKLGNKQNDIANKIIEINSSIHTLKSHHLKVEDKINNTQKEIMQHFKTTQQQLAKKDHMDIIENKINGLHSRLNKTEVIWTQNDSPKGTNLEQEQIVNNIKSELRSEAQKIGNKVSNMYNDIWKKISLLENILKESISQTNITQRNLQDEFQQIVKDQTDNDRFQDFVVDNLYNEIQKNFNNLHHRFENNFQSLFSAQRNAYQKLYEEQFEYETEIEKILEKILYTFINKTISLSKENTDLLEALKGHNSQIIKTITEAKNMVITLAEENSHDHKNLDYSIREVLKRADHVAEIVEELQDQLEEINETRFNPANFLANITQIADKIAPNRRKPDIEMDKTDISNPNNTIHAVEANFSNGVLKIITDDIDPGIDKRESIKNMKENIAEINKNNNTSKIDNIEEFLYLNKALSTSKLTGIISSPSINQSNQIENITIVSNKSIFEKENSNNSSNTIKTEINKQNISVTDEKIETSFILSYINFIKGHTTKEEFLQESIPGKSFKSIHEMIIYMKPLNIVRNEFLKELDKYDREESESEIIGRRDIFFDTTNFEYEDSSDFIQS